jgi:rod shape-determining protein MreD
VNRLPSITARVLLLLAAVVLPALTPGLLPARPDLVLLVVAAAALLHGPLTGGLVGLGGGWLVDLTPPGTEVLGTAAVGYLLVGALIGGSRRYAAWSPLLPWLATGVGLAALLLLRGVSSAAGVGLAAPADLMWTFLVTMLVAAVALPVLVALERWWTVRGWD